MSLPGELAAYATQPGFARLWAKAHRRVEEEGSINARVRLDAPTDAELDAISGLLGRTLRATGPLTVDLRRLDEALRASRYEVCLQELLEALGGPLRDLPAERAATREGTAAAWERAAAHPAIERHAPLAAWLEHVRRRGLHKRLSPQDPFGLLTGALDVLAHLPCEPTAGLPAFAARACGGDTHALDRGPLDTLVCSALAAMAGLVPARGAANRRALWAGHGVICDELSVHCLVLGLAPPGDGYLARSLRLAAQAGQPRRVTLRELQGTAGLRAGPEVFVCENPEVVAAAATELGPSCPPLVCTEGQPSTACLALLRALAAGGAVLHARCDIDPAGLSFLALLATRFDAQPWRMDAATYALTGEGLPWDGPLPDDPTLGAAVRSAGRVQLEEQILDVLLADLRAAASPERERTG